MINSGKTGASLLPKAARLHRSLLSGTALAAFVAAGMVSPMSLRQAQAACTIDTGGSPDNVSCANDSPAGANYDVGSNSNVIVNIGVGPAGGFTVGDGIRIDQNDVADNTFTTIFNVNSSAANPVTITSDGVGNTGQAIEIDTSDGAVTFNSTTGSTITTTGTGGDGINIESDDGAVTVNNGSIIGVREDGIDVFADDARVAITNNQTITAGADGIEIDVDDTADLNGVDGVVVVNNALITAGGAGSDDGIVITTDAADVNVTLAVGGDISGNTGGNGVNISTDEEGNDSGNVTVAVNSQIGAVGNAIGNNGVNIDTDDGDVSVAVGTTGDINATQDAIFVETDDGAVTVDAAGSLTTANGDGIDINADDDVTNVTTRDGASIDSGDNGIEVSSGDGNINITVGDTVRADADGVNVETDNGNVVINTLAADPGATSANAGANGGTLTSDGTGDEDRGIDVTNAFGDTLITTAADITADDGIAVDADGGDTTVNVNAGTDIVADDYGILIDYDSDGTANVANTEIVSVTIAAGASITSNEDGVRILGDDGNVTVRSSSAIDTAGNVIDGGHDGDGIDVSTDQGNIDIQTFAGGTIRADQDGIRATSTDGNINDVDGDVTIRAGANIDAGDSAVHVEDGEDVAVTIDTGVTATGSGLNGVAVVELAADSTIALTNNGTIRSNGDNGTLDTADDLIDQADDLAIDLARDDGNILTTTTNNNGTVIGRFDGSAGADVFNNNSANTWIFTGISDFEGGVDTLNNTFTDAVTNGVIVNAVDGATAETAQYISLEQFTNEGGIVLADQGAGDTFVRDRAYTDGDFTGDGGSIIIDADLSAGDEDADRFIIGGDIDGETVVEVNNIGTGFGQYNPFGIPVIEVQGADNGADVTLAGGPISSGFFNYDIYYTEDTTGRTDDNSPGQNSLANDGLEGTDPTINRMWVLASTLNQQAFELPVIQSGAQEMWHVSTGTWLDRTADLRSAFGETTAAVDLKNEGATVASVGNVTPGAWMKVFGGTQERDISNTSEVPDGLVGDDVTFDDTYNQDFLGFMVGADAGRESVTASGLNQAWIVGLMGGYTRSNLDFDNSDTDVDYQAGSVGIYATYLNGGLYVDGTVKADFGTIDYSSGDDGDFESDFTSVGFVIDTGYRMNMASGLFIEPKATVSYVNTSYDDEEVFGADVSFDDSDSLRGRLGARIGTSIMTASGYAVEPWIEASAWHEFDGDYNTTITSNGFDLPVSHDTGGTFGEVALGANMINAANGWSGFAKGSVKFGEDNLLGFAGGVGLRKSW